MKTLKESIENVYEKFPRVNKKAIDAIIKEYQKSELDTLIKYGHLYITPSIKLEIVPITPRRYVLRNVEYKSVKLYKIKVTIVDDNFYKSIADEYDAFREDLE